MSNKFSNAVFFANDRELQQSDLESQKTSTACMVLIQNSIVLWNYLYLSQLIANNGCLTQRQETVDMIKQGSMSVWQHVNLHGEYNFIKYAANDSPFELDKIFALKL